jgi:hypothetical protein
MAGMKVTDILSGSVDKLKQVIATYITPKKAETFQATTDGSNNPVQEPILTPEEIAEAERSALITSIVITTILVVFSIIIASLVTNHMIMYPFGMRLLIFPLTLVGCILNPFLLFGLMAYYFVFVLVRVYANTSKEPADKLPLMPFIYTLWPLSTHRYETTLMRLLTFPITYYPADEEANLTRMYTMFLESVRSSFPDFEATKKIGGFADLYAKFKNTLNERHAYTELDENGNQITKTPISKEVIDNA